MKSSIIKGSFQVKHLLEKSYKIVLLVHVPEDIQFTIWLKANGVEIDVIDLIGKDMKQIIKCYNQLDLVLGTRGHAQMIPFEMDIVIISLISHNKLKYFLKDNYIEEKGIEVNIIELKEKLIEMIDNQLISFQGFDTRHQEIRKITSENFEIINKCLKINR
jgi:hypothetical protein